MNDQHDLFDGMRTLAPPPDLKGRVLRAARQAAVEAPAAREPWWAGFSRFDLAWAATLLLLLLGNFAVDSWQPGSSAPVPHGPSVEARGLAREVGPTVMGMMERGPRLTSREVQRQMQRLLIEVERL